MKAKITNSLNQNAMPTWRFGTLMALCAFFFLNTITFAQNGRYVVGPGASGVAFPTTSDKGITPFQCMTKDTRNQYLYYGSDLIIEGANSGNITSLAFNVTALPPLSGPPQTTMKNITISLGLTNKSDLTGAIEPTTVYLNLAELEITATGWVTFDLTTINPLGFYWPGSLSPSFNNIIVEICQNSYDKLTYPSLGAGNFEVQASYFSSNYVNNNYFTSDYYTHLPVPGHGLTDGCNMDATSPGTDTDGSFAIKARPDVRFTFMCTGSPTAGNTATVVALKKCVGDINILNVPNGDFHSGLDYQWQSSTNGSTWNDVSGETDETYGIVKADIDMWYRRKTGCGLSSVNSAALPIPQKTWNGSAWKTSTGGASSEPTSAETAVIAGNYTLPGDRNFCSIIVKSGVVSISSSRTLTISQKEVKVTGGSLTFESGARLLQTNGSAVNSGNVTFKRNTQPVRRYDYTYWSSPVENQNLLAFSPLTRADKYYSWNHVAQDWDFEAPLTSSMNPGKGYIIRAPDNYAIAGAGTVWTGSFVGVPNNGDITVQIAGSSDPLVEKWNLIGNPYPSSLNAVAFFNANSAVLNGTFYFWTHNSAPSTIYSGTYTYNYNPSDYASYNKTGSSWSGTKAGSAGLNQSIPNGTIATGQSFMIKGTVDGLSNVTFKNNQRVGTNANFFKLDNNAIAEIEDDAIVDDDAYVEEEGDRNRFWLEYINENGGFKQLLVGYLEGATENYDNGYDGDVMSGEEVTFFSVIKDHKLSIQGKGLPFENSDTVQLGFTATVAGNNVIALVNYDGLFENQDVYLEDTYLNVIHNLKASNYAFVAAKGTFLDRFVLRYTENALNLNPNTISTNSIIAFNRSGDLVIDAGVSNIQSVKVYDVSGRLVLEKSNCQSNNVVLEKLNWNAQLMLVKIITDDKVEVTRKVLF